MQEIKLQHYTGFYDEEIIANILTIQRDEFGINITREDQPDICAIQSFYMQGNGTFIFALSEGKVIGTVGLLDIGNKQVALRKMFVNKAFRGKEYGLAAKLLGEIFPWCKGKGIKNIFLGTTEHFLAAHRFYEKNGFKKIAKEALPETFPIMKVDNIFYKYDFS